MNENEVISKEELHRHIDNSNHPISGQSEGSTLESETTASTGFVPVRGGPTATTQSIHDKEQNFYQIADEIARKPVEKITKEDADEVIRAESRVLGEQPGKGTSSAAVQAIADHNARKKNQ